MEMDIGIPKKERKVIAEGLERVQADTYTLYLKTHFYHWNVTGPMFQTLHLMFETHYNELWMAVDLIAERIRSLLGDAGFPAELEPDRNVVTVFADGGARYASAGLYADRKAEKLFM
mgnify:CR=1 FL=1